MLSGHLQGIFRENVNNKIAETMKSISNAASNSNSNSNSNSSSSCPAPTVTSDSDYVEWADSDLVARFDAIVNDRIGPKNLNRLIRLGTLGTGAVSFATQDGWNITIGRYSSSEHAVLSITVT